MTSRWTSIARLQAATPFWVAGAAGIASLFFLPADVFDKASAEIVALVSLLMAGVLPTAALGATVLRSGGMPVKRIEQYRTALLQQLRIWAGLFVIAFATCAIVVGGKMSGWQILLNLPASLGGQQWNAGKVFSGLLSFSLVLLACRVVTIFDGLRSLISLSADIAVSEAQDRENGAIERAQQAFKQMPPRPGFGAEVQLRH
jgi:hypothetical protein